MKKNIIPALLLLAALCAACSSDNVVAEVPQPTEPETVTTPVTIRASYGDGTTAPASSGDGAITRTAYTESGSTISATWEEDDEILVIFDGHVNTLTLTDGAGTASATFSGSILGSPKSGSLLACYVRDKNNPGALTVDADGDLIYSDDAFLTQDGTLAGAARCNTYSGSTTYGNGTDLHVAFSVNTSMLKFSVLNPYDLYMAEGTKDVTLTYKSGQTVLARAAFSFGSEVESTVYMAVPAGLFTGEQTLIYKTGATEVSRTLSASQADFKPGQTYSRKVDFDNSTKLDNIRYNYTASDGEVLTGKLVNNILYIADGATVTFRGINAIVSLQGNGTIILLEGTTNSVKGISNSPGIYVPSGKTLTIRGSGSLEASSYDYGAGIGAGKNASCGNIVIEGGNITATGSDYCAGIGSGSASSSCGIITISGGTVTATGGNGAAGIGSGYDYSSCGNITITGGTVTATGGSLGAGIGSGLYFSSCGTITISGGIVTATKGLDAPYSIGSGYDSTCGTITIGPKIFGDIPYSPYTCSIP